MAEFQLCSPPTDGISKVRFANDTNLLAVSSWDKSVRIYDAISNIMRFQYSHEAAVLDCCFSRDGSKIYSVGIDKVVRMVDLASGTAVDIGYHDEPIRCVENCEVSGNGQIVTGSWDKSIMFWDARSSNAISTTELPGKVFSMSASQDRLVVATSERHVNIYLLRQPESAEQKRVSSLLHQTRCVKCFPHGRGYVLSSIEGRVAVEFFDPNPEVQAEKYAFKCHRSKNNGTQYVYPVNTIDFHPLHGTFATGGCDGVVNVWDANRKKKISKFPPYNTSVSSLSFNYDGTLLAVAASYTFEEGEKDHPLDAIFIRRLNGIEVRPK